MIEFVYIFVVTGMLEFSIDPGYYLHSAKLDTKNNLSVSKLIYRKTPTLWQKIEKNNN